MTWETGEWNMEEAKDIVRRCMGGVEDDHAARVESPFMLKAAVKEIERLTKQIEKTPIRGLQEGGTERPPTEPVASAPAVGKWHNSLTWECPGGCPGIHATQTARCRRCGAVRPGTCAADLGPSGHMVPGGTPERQVIEPADVGALDAPAPDPVADCPYGPRCVERLSDAADPVTAAEKESESIGVRVAAAIAAERERCAMVCETHARSIRQRYAGIMHDPGDIIAAENCAAAIRALPVAPTAPAVSAPAPQEGTWSEIWRTVIRPVWKCLCPAETGEYHDCDDFGPCRRCGAVRPINPVAQVEKESIGVRVVAAVADEREKIILLCGDVADMRQGSIAELMHVRIDWIRDSPDLWRACAHYIIEQIRLSIATEQPKEDDRGK